MQLIAPSPIPVATALLQPRLDRWALAVVCKATFTLTPGLSPLAADQEALAERDQRWDDDETRSLAAAADLVPFKRSPEVLLVGSACAPGGSMVSSLRVGLSVGAWRKHLEVFGDRWFSGSGELSAPEPFARLPLCWERAAGGPGTANPVGVRMAGAAIPDAWGRVTAPNIQARGTRLAGRHVTLAPAGFGPVAADWPSRAGRLSGRGAARLSRWDDLPLLEGLDPAYFNAAPEDQQISSLVGDEPIVLENIDPRRARLGTTLERVSPRVMVTWATGERVAVDVRVDTLFIDANRGLVALVWRGHVPATDPRLGGWLMLTLDRPSARPGAAAEGPWATPDTEDTTITAITAVGEAPPPPRTSGRQHTLVGTVLASGPALPFLTDTLHDSASPAPPGHAPQDPSASSVLPFRPPSSAPGPTPSLTPLPSPAAPRPLSSPPPSRAPSPLLYPSPPPPAPATPPPPSLSAPRPLSYPPLPAVTIPSPSPAPTFTAAAAVVDRAPVPEPEPGSWPEQPALLGPIPVSAPAEPEPEPAPAVDPTPAAAPPEAAPEDPSIEICAAIAASIARRPDRAAEVLREREMDPEAWARHDKRWREAIREERCRGKSDLRRAHDAAFVAQLERERGPITPVELSELTVATERGVRPAALAKLGLPAEAVMPVERVMLARSLADPELRASMRAALAAARRA